MIPAGGSDPSDRWAEFRIASAARSCAGLRRSREGTLSMEAHGASLHTPHPDAVEFVRFCYRRRRVGWPELYDEMCAVAARGKFRGMSTDELSGLGIGFSLFDMPGLAGLAAKVVAEEQAMRRPVAVATDLPVRVEVVPTRAADLPAEPVERSFDVLIRLAPAPA